MSRAGPPPSRWLALAAWTAAATVLVALAAGLPSRTFFVGDPGVKLIAARNVIARPTRPLEIPLPTLDGDPAPYVEPFFTRHGDHTHAVTSELFPIVTAPFLHAFGARGAYVLPMLGFLLTVAACGRLARVLDPLRAAAPAAVAAGLLTPLLFYGLEFWEHAPAVGLATLATAMLAEHRGARQAFASGLLLGTAVLLRPEALWYAVAVLLCARLLAPGPSRTALVAAAWGTGAALVPLAVYTMVHFGSLLTPHLAGNPGIWSGQWLATRQDVIAAWLLSLDRSSLWRAAPALALAAVPLRGPAPGGRRFLAAAAALTTALVVLTAPNDGGGQWGPRYLLFACVPLAVLASDGLVALWHRGRAAALLAGLAIMGGAAVQRDAYRELRSAKLTYARVLAFVERTAPPGSYVVTDLWWLDQVAASGADRRHFLFAEDGARADEILGRLDAARAPALTLITSRTERAGLLDRHGSRCYREHDRSEIVERGLIAVRLSRECQP
jgi:hypothetical protein